MVVSPLSFSASIIKLKPSVSSRSASALDVSMLLAAVTDIPLLPDRFSSDGLTVFWREVALRKEFLAVRLDISRKAERVVARALFCQFGVARFQCFDDRHMLGQRG